MKKGLFITIEGPDGSGKTTIQRDIQEILFQQGLKFEVTREPGGIDIAEQIRRIVLDPKNTEMDARTEALLYAAARRQHLMQKVLPALLEGKNVLCDRFVDSSLAYQGIEHELGFEEVLQINQFAIQDTMPDFTLLLMVEPEVGLERIAQGRKADEVDRLDSEALAFHQKVYQGYQMVTEKFPERVHVIDAGQDYQTVLAEAVDAIIHFLQKRDEE